MHLWIDMSRQAYLFNKRMRAIKADHSAAELGHAMPGKMSAQQSNSDDGVEVGSI